MNKIKTFFRKLKFVLKHDFFSIENVVLIVAIILCAVWTYQAIMAMSRNWELSERLTAERKTLELASIEVEAAELENEYYKSDEYQELLARRNLDKQFEGEKMVVMPINSDEAKNKHKEKPAIQEEKTYSNFDQWMRYLFPSY